MVALRSVFIWVLLVVWIVAHPAATAQSYALDTRPQIGAFLNGNLPPYAPPVPGDWSAVVAFTNLTFTNAVGLCPVPGTDLLCVWEREGRAWTFTNSPSASAKRLLLDVSDQCQGWDDGGFLGLAFHPGFSTNHQVFIWYKWVPPGTVEGDAFNRPPIFKSNRNRLARFTADTTLFASPKSETVLIDQEATSVWHMGGGMFFHPTDGFLYLTIGDDEDATTTQHIDGNLFSGVIRIDVDSRGGSVSHPPPRQPNNGVTANYFIPNDNPFVGKTNALEEFFALGLRSPHRMTVDPGSGRIFIGDVGNEDREEIDVIEPGEPFGLNFQWNRIEGLHGDLTGDYPGVNKRPLLDYDHSEGTAVIGGYVYRGSALARELGGKYIFGDNGRKIIWALDETTSPPTKIPLCIMPTGDGPNSGSDYTGLSSFGLDQAGEIYLCQMSSVGGRIYKLVHGDAPDPMPIPKLLSQTGVFSVPASLAPRTGLLPYSVNVPLWSDGAVKTRWLALPADATIGFAPTGEWTFPVGTVLAKHFELPVDDRHPEVTRRLETRLLVLDTNGTVYGATYKWRPDNSDADLLTNSLVENITITNASGTVRTQPWYYPGRGDCLRCHTRAAGYVLGPKTRQLNGNFTYADSGQTDNQLRVWNHLGLFSPALEETKIPEYDALAALTSNASVELRARSYLDANCAGCHRPGGVPSLWDARFDTPLGQAGIINATPLNSIGVANAKIVAPRHPEHSVLHVRLSSLDPDIKMPPVGKNVVDTNAASVLSDWINSLAPPPDQLPGVWNSQDIGDVAFAGDVNYQGGAFTLSGSGADIWNTADAFHFVNRAVRGNGEIVVHVNSVDDTHEWAKAGVMIRESLAADARHVCLCVTPGHGVVLINRSVTGGSSDIASGPNVTAPFWLKLKRDGNTLSGYASPDGVDWALVGTVNFPATDTIFVGLALTSADNHRLNTSTFDHLYLPGAFLGDNVPGASLAFPQNYTVYTAPSPISLQLEANDPDGILAQVTYSLARQDPIVITNAPLSYDLTGLGAGTYTLGAAAVDQFGVNGATNPPITFFVTPPGGFALKVNFQRSDSAVPAGYLADVGQVLDDRHNGYFYGWDVDRTSSAFERHSTLSPDQRYDTGVYIKDSFANAKWEILVPNGSYRVRLVVGDPYSIVGRYSLSWEGVKFMNVWATAANRWIATTNIVKVADGRLTLSADNAAAAAAVNFLELERANDPPMAAEIQLTGGAPTVTIDGLPGNVYVIEATTNFINWVPVSTNVAPQLPYDFLDSTATGYPLRFYRIRGL